MRALTAEQMRAADAAAVARIGEVALMRSAGEALAEALRMVAPAARKIVAFAGPGNNGGDAFAAFAALGGPSQRIVYALPAPNISAGRRDAQRQAAAAGVVTRPFPLSYEEAVAALEGADLAVDALLGTGARPTISHELEAPVAALCASRAPVFAIDVPTGVDATTGALLGGGNPLLVTPDSVLMAPTVDGQWVYVLDNSGNLYALTIDPSIPKIAAKPGRRSAASFMIRQ